MLKCLIQIEGTYVFLESMTTGREPQHTNTVKALRRIRAIIAKSRRKA